MQNMFSVPDFRPDFVHLAPMMHSSKLLNHARIFTLLTCIDGVKTGQLYNLLLNQSYLSNCTNNRALSSVDVENYKPL